MKEVIKIENLCKSFGEIKAVNDLSFSVKRGELFAFLGVNGAGKSTTISMICGTLKKDGGKIIINGVDAEENRADTNKKIGVVFQNSVLDKPLTVYDNLQARASLYGIVGEEFKDKLNAVSSVLEMKSILNRPLSKLSGGQKRRVDIARALINDPEILILDEPTTGLDPVTRKLVWKTVNDIRKERNMTVILTTHYMEEASEADYVVIINGGKLVAEGSPLDLKTKYTGDFLSVYNAEEKEIKKLNKPYEQIAGGYRITLKNTKEATALIVNNPELFSDYELHKGKMDDVFIAVTGVKPEGDN